MKKVPCPEHLFHSPRINFRAVVRSREWLEINSNSPLRNEALFLFDYKIKQKQDNYCPDGSGQYGSEPATAEGKSKLAKYPVTKRATYDTNNDVAHQTQATALVENTSQPAGCSTDKKRNEYFHLFKNFRLNFNDPEKY